MQLRIGAAIFSVNLIFLAAAYLVFARLLYLRLYPEIVNNRGRARLSLGIVSAIGVTGAGLYGIPGSLHAAEGSRQLPTDMEIAFGSFGGYWGVLIGMCIASGLLRFPLLRSLDALVLAILAGGIIARLPAFFTDTGDPTVFGPGSSLMYNWSTYDVLAHFIVAILVWKILSNAGTPAGIAVVAYLVSYGLLRFGLEFLRSTFYFYEPFTHGHLMATVQIIVGLLLWRKMARNSSEDNPRARERV